MSKTHLAILTACLLAACEAEPKVQGVYECRQTWTERKVKFDTRDTRTKFILGISNSRVEFFDLLSLRLMQILEKDDWLCKTKEQWAAGR